jgi:hypothetical protein
MNVASIPSMIAATRVAAGLEHDEGILGKIVIPAGDGLLQVVGSLAVDAGRTAPTGPTRGRRRRGRRPQKSREIGLRITVRRAQRIKVDTAANAIVAPQRLLVPVRQRCHGLLIEVNYRE